MAKRDEERERRLAEALRENLRRRKAQARRDSGRETILPGTGSGTARSAVEGGAFQAEDPLHHPSDGPPPRSGEDL